MEMVKVLLGGIVLMSLGIVLTLSFATPAPAVPPGSLDASFNSPQGFAMSTNAEDTKDRGVEVEVQADGKIVALGYSNNSWNEDLMIARYTADGIPDPGFHNDGFVYYDGGGNDRGLGLALQDDGKILATGFTTNGTHRDVLLLRYLENGTLDATFGKNGVVTFSSPGSFTDIGFGIACEEDSGILVVGEISNTSHQDAMVLHYTKDGSPDLRFGNNGFFTFGGTNMDRGFAGAIQQDGKILVTGSCVVNDRDDVLLFRLNPNGTLDRTFGHDGVVLYSSPGDNFDYGNCITLQEDEKIVISGAASIGTTFDLLLLRYNPDGTLDPTFGTGGVVHHGDGGERDNYGYAHSIQRDGKIVVTGYAETSTSDDVLVVRFDQWGHPDPTFGSAGQVLWNGPGDQRDYGQGIALQDDGKIMITGFSHHGASEDLLLMRLWP
jgi:uncharacterized delta-60 repeat protein